jgi:hypothetical protein
MNSERKGSRTSARYGNCPRMRAATRQPTRNRSGLFGRKKDHGRAETALLARYAAVTVEEGGGR